MNLSMPLPNDGYFLAKATSIGSSDAELHAKIETERLTEIARCMAFAAEQLRNAEPMGHS